MKKRLFTIFVAALACLAAAFTLAGCGDSDKKKGGSNNTQDAYWTNVAASVVTDAYAVQASNIEVEINEWEIDKASDKRTDTDKMVVTQDGELKGAFGRVSGKYNGYVVGKVNYTEDYTTDKGEKKHDSGVLFDMAAGISDNEMFVFMDGKESVTMKHNVMQKLPDDIYTLQDEIFAADGILHKLMGGNKAGDINTYIKGIFEKFCTVTGSGATRTITFDPDMLYDLNGAFNAKPLNMLLDEMFGKGFYANLGNKANELLNKTVGQVRDDIVKSGVTKDELYDFIEKIMEIAGMTNVDIDAYLDMPMIGETALKDTKLIDLIVYFGKTDAETIEKTIETVLSEYGDMTVYAIADSMSGKELNLVGIVKQFLDEYVPLVKQACTISATTDKSGNIKSIDIALNDFSIEWKDYYDEVDNVEYYNGLKITGNLSLVPNSGNPAENNSAKEKVTEKLGMFEANATIPVECGDCSYELATDGDGVVTSIKAHVEYTYTDSSSDEYIDTDEDGVEEMYVTREIITKSADLEYKYSDGAIMELSDYPTGWYRLSLDITPLYGENNPYVDVHYTYSTQVCLVTDLKAYKDSYGKSGFKVISTEETGEETKQEEYFSGDGFYLDKNDISLYYKSETKEWSNKYSVTHQ